MYLYIFILEFFHVLVDQDIKPPISHSSRLSGSPKIEMEEERLPLITKGAQKLVETDECTSSTTVYCSKILITKESNMVPLQASGRTSNIKKRKSSKRFKGFDSSRKVNLSISKSGADTVNDNKDVSGCNLQPRSITKASTGKHGIEETGEGSIFKVDKEHINAECVPVPLPIIHEEFRCRSENCIFRTSVRQELIQHIIIEHDE